MSIFLNKRSIRNFLALFVVIFVLFASKTARANILSPGIINTCGEIAITGTYTLGSNISTSTGPCITVTSGGLATSTIIDGAGLYTVTGDVVGDGSGSGIPGHNFTVQNVTITGTTTSNGGTGAVGGSIIISSSTVGTISSIGGTGANGGSVTISSPTINLTGLNLYMTGGSLTLNYTTLIHTNFIFPALSDLTLNGPGNFPGDLGAFGGGMIISSADGGSCNIAVAGTTTLVSNLTENCTVATNGVIIDGAGYTLNGNIIATSTGDGYGISLMNITATGIVNTSGAISATLNGNGFNGGSISISSSMIAFVMSSGGNSRGSGLGGVAGSIFSTNSNITSISALGGGSLASVGGQGGFVTISGTTINLASTTINTQGGFSYTGYGGWGGNVTISGTNVNLSGMILHDGEGVNIEGNKRGVPACLGTPSCIPPALRSNLTIMSSSSLVTNSSTYFYDVTRLMVNNVLYGEWNGVFNNTTSYYFNDQAPGAGNDGNWSNASNWWTDASSSNPAGTVPSILSEATVLSTVTNASSNASVDTAIFDNNSQNDININAVHGFIFNDTSVNNATITGTSTFNVSSLNNGKVIGEAIFADNSSENSGSTTNDLVSAYSHNQGSLKYMVSSSDGTKLAAAVNGGQIYTSTDSGATWTVSSSPSSNWSSITSSSDGTKLAAAVNGGQIYTSTDSGATWTVSSSPSSNWSSITSSSDGTKLAAAVNGGQIYTSTDSGATWTVSSSPSSNWSSITSSSDGTKLAAAVNGGQIYTSTDSGATWTVSSSPSSNWSSITSSSDGTKLAAAVNGGQIYTSTDSGATWTVNNSSPSGNWLSVSFSADGTKLAALEINTHSVTQIYIFTNSGGGWIARNSLYSNFVSESASAIQSVIISSDGSKIIANMINGVTDIFYTNYSDSPIRQYTLLSDGTWISVGGRNFTNTGIGTTSTNWIVQAVSTQVSLVGATYSTSSDMFEALSGGSFTPSSSINGGAAVVPQIVVISPAASTTVAKWLPSINWDTSNICQYSYNGFNSMNVVDCSKNGADIPKPISAGSQTLYLQGTDSRGDLTQTSIVFTYDNTSPIYTACGSDLMDEATRQYYYLSGNVTGDCIATVGVKLYGVNPTTGSTTGYTINGNIISTSTTNGNSIVLNNVVVTGSIIASGATNTNGAGYNGGNITIDPSITGTVISNGGDGTTKGGNGGNISITNSAGIATTSTTINANGGSATQCGYGGSGGNVNLASSTYGTVSNIAGTNKTTTIASGGYCPNPPFGSSGSSGSSQSSGQYTSPTEEIIMTPIVSPTPTPIPTPAPKIAPSYSGGSTGSYTIPTASTSAATSTATTTAVLIIPPTRQSQIFTSISKAATKVAQTVANTAHAVESSPVSKPVQATGLLAGLVASVSMIDAGAAAPLAAEEAVLLPIRLWGLLMVGLGIRKRARPWGTVYDSVTKQPIDPAFVTVKDANGKVVAESITDLDGRYGFLLPDGTYYISVKKTNYDFPSKKMTGKTSDELYSDLYFGEPVTVKAGEVLDKNIPMDQMNFDWNEQAKKERSIMLFHSKNERIWAVTSSYIYGVGLAISVIITVAKPTWYNMVILVAYALVLTFLEFGLKRKKLGLVIDKVTGEPLSYAIIHVTTPDHKVTLRSAACDAKGRYYCIIPKGEYCVQIEKKNQDGSYSKVYESQQSYSGSGIVNKNFVV